MKKKYLSEFEQFLYKFFANNFYINKFILNKTPYRYLQCIEQSTINSSFNWNIVRKLFSNININLYIYISKRHIVAVSTSSHLWKFTLWKFWFSYPYGTIETSITHWNVKLKSIYCLCAFLSCKHTLHFLLFSQIKQKYKFQNNSSNTNRNRDISSIIL